MNISLDGSQIDQCIILSKSLLTLFPERMHAVSLQGHLLTGGDGRTLTAISGHLFDAYAYGYFRTLLVKIEAPETRRGEILTIGGRNAVIEDVALDIAKFELHSPTKENREEWFTPSGDDWITESYVLSLELKQTDEFTKVLERLALDRDLPESSAPRNWALQRVLTTRLKRLRTLLPRHHFATAASRVLRGSPSAEPDLFMFLCEAVWFWLEDGPLPPETIESVERLLALGLDHFDPNIRLASIISSAKYCASLSQQTEGADSPHLTIRLVSSLGRLVSSSYLSETTYFDRVYQTCLYVLPSVSDARQQFLLDAVELLKSIPRGELGLGRWIESVDDPADVALVLFILLWRAPWLQDIEIVNHVGRRARLVHALRAKFLYRKKLTTITVLCSVIPDEALFSEWMQQATKRGETNSFVMRVAARTITSVQAAGDEKIICGGDLLQLLVSDARLEQELESLAR